MHIVSKGNLRFQFGMHPDVAKMISLNYDVQHLMQQFLVKTEFTRISTCAELFCWVCIDQTKALFISTEHMETKAGKMRVVRRNNFGLFILEKMST